MKTKEETLHSAIVNELPITGGMTIKDTRALIIRDDKTEAVVPMTDAIIINGILNIYIDLHAYAGSRSTGEARMGNVLTQLKEAIT